MVEKALQPAYSPLPPFSRHPTLLHSSLLPSPVLINEGLAIRRERQRAVLTNCGRFAMPSWRQMRVPIYLHLSAEPRGKLNLCLPDLPEMRTVKR